MINSSLINSPAHRYCLFKSKSRTAVSITELHENLACPCPLVELHFAPESNLSFFAWSTGPLSSGLAACPGLSYSTLRQHWIARCSWTWSPFIICDCGQAAPTSWHALLSLLLNPCSFFKAPQRFPLLFSGAFLSRPPFLVICPLPWQSNSQPSHVTTAAPPSHCLQYCTVDDGLFFFLVIFIKFQFITYLFFKLFILYWSGTDQQCCDTSGGQQRSQPFTYIYSFSPKRPS